MVLNVRHATWTTPKHGLSTFHIYPSAKHVGTRFESTKIDTNLVSKQRCDAVHIPPIIKKTTTNNKKLTKIMTSKRKKKYIFYKTSDNRVW